MVVDIDIAKLSDVGHSGVRRAALFLGLGLNAAYREDFRDYELHKIPYASDQTSLLVDFFPSDLPPEQISTFKEEFALWIMGCGVRELLEHYALFLDQIHNFALLVRESKGALESINPQREQNRFHLRLGIPDKLDTLRDRFAIEPSEPECIKQLYEARNCLTHDLGVITPRRCNSADTFTMTWLAFELFAKGAKSGIERSVISLIGDRTNEETSILGRIVGRERKFDRGTRLQLSRQDLSEICFFFRSRAIPSVIESFIGFLKAQGIPLSEKK